MGGGSEDRRHIYVDQRGAINFDASIDFEAR